MSGPYCRDCQDRDQVDVRLHVGNPTDGPVYRCVNCGFEGDSASWVTAQQRAEMLERDAQTLEEKNAQLFFFGGKGPVGGDLEVRNSRRKGSGG